MKHKIPGVTDELLLKAKEEFLKEGYNGANLRRIAAAANVSTNSIYVRFAGKKGLFDAIVKETADELYSMLSDMNSRVEAEEDIEQALDRSGQYTIETIDYIYDHFDEFKLIFCQSAGTEYEHYIERLSEIEENAYRQYIEKNQLDIDTSDIFIRVISQMGYRFLFEAVANDLTREEAVSVMNKVIKYSNAGLEAILGQ